MLDKVQFFKEELTNRKEINHEYQKMSEFIKYQYIDWIE